MTMLLIGIWIGAPVGFVLCSIMSSGARADEMRVRVMEREGAVAERLRAE